MTGPAVQPGPALVLVGPPGAGKTTVGRLVARQLAMSFRDTDTDVERAAGTTVAEVFLVDGEPRFRDLERAAVVAALAEHRGVLAVGGGAVLSDLTRADLAGRPVVFLAVGLADAAKRVGLARSRPLLMENPRATLGRMLAEREPRYAAVARARVATDGRTPVEVAAEVAALVIGWQSGAGSGAGTAPGAMPTIRGEAR